MRQYFHNQVDLLISLLPHIEEEKCFALKGGTAINLFFRDMPRLSVDIDLVYLPIEGREESMTKISTALDNIYSSISKGKDIKVSTLGGVGNFKKLICSRAAAEVKIEVNLVIRGAIHKPVKRELSQRAQSIFKKYSTIDCLSLEETYAGKLCAALDRQHPRDLFDVMVLMENEGISENMKDTFLVYLLSHNRPIAELLNPNSRDIEEDFSKSFEGMTDEVVELDSLLETRSKMVNKVGSILNDRDKEFLISFKAKKPRWELLTLGNVSHLPAIRWKMENIRRMDGEKHRISLMKLENLLGRI